MKSRTSFCNGTILKRGLLRGAPLWAVYFIGWLVAMPMMMLNRGSYAEPVELSSYVLGAAVANANLIPFFYGLGAACILFSYLYRSRSANFFAALPLKREQMFLTNYLAGMLYMAVPNLIIAALTYLAGLACGANLGMEVLQWLGISALGYVFYFSFAVLLAMIVGHLAALPLLYLVLNFTAVVLELIVRELMEAFIYGAYFDGDMVLGWMSPIFEFLIEGNGITIEAVFDNAHQIVDYRLQNWQSMVILGAVGAALAAIAFVLFRFRRMESAGDVIAVRRLRPVFLYGFTFGCSLVIGWLLSVVLVSEVYSGAFIQVLLCLMVGAVMGYFLGEMMLHKTFRVFRLRNLSNCGVVCLVILALMCACRFDLFGYSSYVPSADQVVSVSLGHTEANTSDPGVIEQTVLLHESILEQQAQTEHLIETSLEGYNPMVYLNYELENGRTVRRRYRLPVTEETARDPQSLIRRYEEAYNNPEYIVDRMLPQDYSVDRIFRAYIYAEGEEYYLTRQEAYDLLTNAVEPDLRTTELGTERYTERYGLEAVDSGWLDVYLEVQFVRQGEEDGYETTAVYYVDNVGYHYYSLHITADAVRTIEALTAYGVPAKVFQPEQDGLK